MVKRLLLALGALALVLSLALAQQPPTPTPGLMLPLPDGMVPPPPEDGPETFEAFVADVFAAIAGRDGVMALDELLDYMRGFAPPPDASQGSIPGSFGAADMGVSPDPPPCTDELVAAEMVPQATDVPCGHSSGNLVFRTACNADGYNSQTVSLPPGRVAGCFGIEAITGDLVILYIYPEDDPGDVIFDSDRDGLENIHQVTVAGERVYRVELDMDRSAPNARVTVRLVDHPDGI